MALSARLLRPRASGAGFDPRSISSLAAWWDASDPSTVSLSGSSITSITDKSGNGRTASQGTGANQPTYQTEVQNGRNVMRFDGSNDILTTSAFAFPAAASAVMVAKSSNWSAPSVYGHFLVHGYAPSSPDSNLTTGVAFLAQKAGNLAGWQTGDLGAFGNGYNSGQSPRAMGPTTSGSDFRIVSTVLSSATATMHVNNTLTSTRVTDVGSAIDTSKTYAMGIGRNLISEPWNGDGGEILVYHKALSTAERQAIERYLAAKWGISLA